MNTQIHKSERPRWENWLIWVAILGAMLLVLAPRAADRERAVSVEEKEMRLPGPEPLPRTDGLPFSARDVVQYFSTVLEMSPEKGKAGASYFENQQATTAEDRWRIEIWTETKSVVVQFAVGGDYGLNYAREFFECPLFERDESEKLYEMLAHAQTSPGVTLRRFTVAMLYKETESQQVLLLKFTSLGAS